MTGGKVADTSNRDKNEKWRRKKIVTVHGPPNVVFRSEVVNLSGYGKMAYDILQLAAIQTTTYSVHVSMVATDSQPIRKSSAAFAERKATLIVHRCRRVHAQPSTVP